MQRIAEALGARMEEIAALIAQEVGHAAQALQHDPGRACRRRPSARCRSCWPRCAWEEEIGNSLIVREPVGVVGAITPWNYPLHQIAAKVAPAMAAGCTVVLKPSQVAPLNAVLLADVLDDVGLPAGVFNLVTGRGSVIGEALALHPDVDMISFTGSTAAGRRVSEAAAGTIKRVALELGGKSPNVILEDADFQTAIQDGVGEVLLELRPDVQRADADARPALAPGRGRADRRRGRRAVQAGRPVRARHHARPARVRGSAREGARLHQQAASRRGPSS